MAVKPITNKQVVASSNINRGKQTTTKNDVDFSVVSKGVYFLKIEMGDLVFIEKLIVR